jgi:hypothetical protein
LTGLINRAVESDKAHHSDADTAANDDAHADHPPDADESQEPV